MRQIKQYLIQGNSLNFSSADSIVAGCQVTVFIITFFFLCFLFLFEVSLPYYGFLHSQVILTIEHYYFNSTRTMRGVRSYFQVVQARQEILWIVKTNFTRQSNDVSC